MESAFPPNPALPSSSEIVGVHGVVARSMHRVCEGHAAIGGTQSERLKTHQSHLLALTATDVAAWSLDMAEQSNTKSKAPVQENSLHDYMEISAAFAILAGILLILDQLDFLPQRFAVSNDMSYALVFVIGLVASISTCIAVTGGLLVAIAAKYNEASRSLTGLQRLKPHIFLISGALSPTRFWAAPSAPSAPHSRSRPK